MQFFHDDDVSEDNQEWSYEIQHMISELECYPKPYISFHYYQEDLEVARESLGLPRNRDTEFEKIEIDLKNLRANLSRAVFLEKQKPEMLEHAKMEFHCYMDQTLSKMKNDQWNTYTKLRKIYNCSQKFVKKVKKISLVQKLRIWAKNVKSKSFKSPSPNKIRRKITFAE
jgi:hypothetical protein